MPDFRVADTAPEHPKLRAAGLAAIGLWAAAGAFAMRELTDGWVPDYWVGTWPAGKRHAATLVKVGLWRTTTRHGIPGFSFHDWIEYQRPADKINEERERARERAAKSRARAAHVPTKSHDSLPLPLEETQVGEVTPRSERANAKSGAPHALPFPDGWTPHDGHRRTAANKRVDLGHEAVQFEAHARAHGREAIDWDAAFTVWLGNAKPTGPNPFLRSSNGTDANIAALIQAGQDQPRAIGGA